MFVSETTKGICRTVGGTSVLMTLGATTNASMSTFRCLIHRLLPGPCYHCCMKPVKLTPDLMSVFMKCIKTTMADTYAAHPDYPKITTTHLQSFVKRFLGHWNRANSSENDGTPSDKANEPSEVKANETDEK